MTRNGWYYKKQVNGRPLEFGPYTREEMLGFFNHGVIDKDTPTRYGELPWQPFKTYLSSHRVGLGNRVKKFFLFLKLKDNRVKVLYGVAFLLVLVYFATRPSPLPQWSASNSKPGTGAYGGSHQIPDVRVPKVHPSSPYVHPLQKPLTREKVIYFTNQARSGNDMHPLKENVFLNAIAEERAKDMFEKQYFAHTSPTGEEDSDIARKVGYHYNRLGENIAKGWYLNDKKLVDGWMQSPGHRKNILNVEFDEIGVAVIKGRYDGDEVIIGVQIFGRQSPPVD